MIHGLWLVHHVGPVQLYRPVGWHRETYEVTVHETVIPAHQVVMIEGAPVANAARSCVDAMVGAGPGEALALMDSALRLGVQRADLHAMVPRPEDWRHRLINLGDPRSESALESVSRWVIHSAGLPKPELQVTLRLGDGSRARVDFIWEQQRVVGEADGALKYDDDGLAMAAQEIRQEAVEGRGYRVIRWGWKEAVKDPRLLPDLLRGPLGA